MQQQQDINQSNTTVNSQNSCQEQSEIQLNSNLSVNHIENDVGFGVFQEKIQFLNYEDCYIKIVPVQDSQSQENSLLYLTIFSEETAFENLKYTCFINFQEEYQKQRNLQDIFDGLELKELGTAFAEFFSQNTYTFVQDIQNNNIVKLQLTTKMVIRNKEKTIHFEFLFQKQIKQQQQSLESALSSMQKSMVKENKQNKEFQKQVLQQNLEQKQILEYLQTFILENLQKQNDKIEKIDQNLTNFQLNTQKSFKLVQDNQTTQIKGINENLEKTQEISEILTQNQNNIVQQLANYQNEMNLKFEKSNQDFDKLYQQNNNNNNNNQQLFQEQNLLINQNFEQLKTNQTTQIKGINEELEKTQEISEILTQNQNNIVEKLANYQNEMNQKFEKSYQDFDKLYQQNTKSNNNKQQIFQEQNQMINQNFKQLEQQFQQIKTNLQEKLQEQTNLQNPKFKEIQTQQQLIKDQFQEQLNKNDQKITTLLKDQIQNNQQQSLEYLQNILRQLYCKKNKEIDLFYIKKIINIQSKSYDVFQDFCREIFIIERQQQIFETKDKLKNVIKLFSDDKKMLSLSIMLPHQFDNKYNPKQILKSNTKNITHDEFKNKCANKSNCLILTRVKETENSDWEVYGGYAPDKTIFDKEGSYCKTDQTEQYNFPFTFDLNQNIKRNLINKDISCYYRNSDSYFYFYNCDLYLNNSNVFYFADDDNNYKSLHQEENQNQNRYNDKKVYDAEIEVIQLF